MLTKCLGCENLELFLASREKVFVDTCLNFYLCTGQLIGSTCMLITTNHYMMFGIVSVGLVSTISALALLLMHWDHLQFGLHFEIKLLDRIRFGKT